MQEDGVIGAVEEILEFLFAFPYCLLSQDAVGDIPTHAYQAYDCVATVPQRHLGCYIPLAFTCLIDYRLHAV